MELIKDQLFNPESYDHDELFATRWTLHHVGLRILQLFAPYMPFVTETIYTNFAENKTIDSIHKTKFDQLQVSYAFEAQAKTMAYILHVIGQVRKVKTQHQLSLRTELQSLTIYVQDKEILELLKQQEQLVKGATKAQEFFYKDALLDQSELKEIKGVWHAHVLATLD